MVQAFLGIGGNLGYRHANLRSVMKRLRQQMTVVSNSSLYETEPVGFKNQPNFLNAVVKVDATDDPYELFRIIMDVEADLGRRRTFVNAPRTVDVDVLLFGEHVIESDDLTVPHPRMHTRAFVMVPLAEIAPDVVHPKLKRSAAEIVADFGDTSDVVVPIMGPEWATPHGFD